MPPTPLQNSYSSFEEEQGHFEVGDKMWSARNGTVIAKLETLVGPDDIDVDFRRILEDARDENGCAIFEIFSTDGPSKFLVVSRSRWDKYQRRRNAPRRQNSSGSSSETVARGSGRQRGALEKKVMETVEDYLENASMQKWTSRPWRA